MIEGEHNERSTARWYKDWEKWGYKKERKEGDTKKERWYKNEKKLGRRKEGMKLGNKEDWFLN